MFNNQISVILVVLQEEKSNQIMSPGVQSTQPLLDEDSKDRQRKIYRQSRRTGARV